MRLLLAFFQILRYADDMEMRIMDVSSIADMSMDISLTRTQDAVSMSVLKSAVNYEKTSGEEVVQMINSTPSFGHLLDRLA